MHAEKRETHTSLSGHFIWCLSFTTWFLSNREGVRQTGSRVSLENSFSIVYLCLFTLRKKLIQKESRKFYKCLKPLVLQKENKNIILKSVYIPGLLIVLLRSRGKMDAVPPHGRYLRNPYPHASTRKGTNCSAACPPWSLANGRADHMAELSLQGKKAPGSGSPHCKRPHPRL